MRIRHIAPLALVLLAPFAACNFDDQGSHASDTVIDDTDVDSKSVTTRRVSLRRAPALWGQVTESGLSSQAFGLTADAGFQTLRHIASPEGRIYTRSQQTYKGVPIWGEHVITTREQTGEVVGMHGYLIKGLENTQLDVVPGFDASRALADMQLEHSLTRGAVKKFNYQNETSELVIFIDHNAPKLSYAVSFFADTEEGGDPARPTFLVDAKTGEILFQFDGLTTADATGPGGNNKTGQYDYGIDFGFLDVAFSGGTSTMNNVDVKTVNLNHGTSGSTAFSFAGTHNTVKQINGAFSPLNDAHFFGGVVFGMYSDWYQTAPLSFQLTMRVHYSTNYQNAFWNGSSMTFGDGGSTFYPLVSLDVSSHEVSHGFTEQNSGLIYSAQSGGINEAFSDIAGEAAEFYNSGSNDWQVGADIFKAAGALRYMDDPPLDGSSIGHADDYVPGMDVHYSSGVYNKAFYLLATTAGWDTRKAFDVFVRANQLYWSPSSDYVDAFAGIETATTDLGYSLTDVQAAFAQVGIGSAPPPPPPPPGCNTLTTTFASNNGQSGNMFDLEAINAVSVAGFDVNLDPGTWNLEIYHRAGSYVGHETNAASWTLVTTATGVASAGTNLPTPVGLTSAVAIPAGQTHSFYITVTNGTSMNYTNGTAAGAVYADDGNIRLFEGLGKSYPFGSSYSPRVWNGSVNYSVASTGDLTTTFANNNAQNGNMFDIEALNDIRVTGFDANMRAGTHNVEIYHRVGSYVGHETNSASWTLVGSATGVTSNGDGVATPVPVSLTIDATAGETHSFYVTSTGSTSYLNYTNGTSEGAVYAQDTNIAVHEGVGKRYPFGSTYRPRVWNGTVHYEAVSCQ